MFRFLLSQLQHFLIECLWRSLFPHRTTRRLEPIEIIPVHDLNPKCISPNPDLVIIFFHGIAFGNDEWKETWTSTTTNGRNEPICWPEKWLPEDMGNNVRILSLSYDSNLMGVHNNVANIGKNLIHSLVTSREEPAVWFPLIPPPFEAGKKLAGSAIFAAAVATFEAKQNGVHSSVQKIKKLLQESGYEQMKAKICELEGKLSKEMAKVDVIWQDLANLGAAKEDLIRKVQEKFGPGNY